MPENKERLEKGIDLIRRMHNDLVDLEVQLQMELAGNPADSGFTEAKEDLQAYWTEFVSLFGED